jgi:hypothetical protein
MNIWIGERRISISDDYLRHTKRDILIKEQIRYLKGVATEKEIADAMGKLYDTFHPKRPQKRKSSEEGAE